MGVEETALELIALTYDAALAPEKRRAFMERTAQSLGARSAGLREVNYDAEHVQLFETVGFDPAYVAAYRQHFVHLDNFAPAYINTPIGTVVTGDEVVPWERQCKTEFGNDYLIAQNIRHLMGTILARDENHHLLFGVQRAPGQAAFDAEDRRLFGLVAPHIARAVQIQGQMTAVSLQKHWVWSALDCLRVGVILLDGRGKPLHLNRAAERLAGGGKGFGAGREGLTLPSATDTARLRRLIADAADLATGRGGAAGGCLRVRMAGSRAATLQFQVIPLPHGLSERPWAPSQADGCVAVFVSTPGGPRLSWIRMMALHGFTRAEARLGSLLAAGVSLEEAAETLSISIHTVRSQLKTVFAKTGVTRQAELVALLLADMLTDPADDSLEPAP